MLLPPEEHKQDFPHGRPILLSCILLCFLGPGMADVVGASFRHFQGCDRMFEPLPPGAQVWRGCERPGCLKVARTSPVPQRRLLTVPISSTSASQLCDHRMRGRTASPRPKGLPVTGSVTDLTSAATQLPRGPGPVTCPSEAALWLWEAARPAQSGWVPLALCPQSCWTFLRCQISTLMCN